MGVDIRVETNTGAIETHGAPGPAGSIGEGRRDRVALLMYNCVESWLAYLAVTRIGAVVVRTNFRLSAEELEYALNDSGTKLVIGHPDLLERIAERRATIEASAYVTLGPATDQWERIGRRMPDIAAARDLIQSGAMVDAAGLGDIVALS